MISRISFWAEKGRVTAMLWLDFDFRTGTVNPKFSGLSVYFDGPYGAGFLDAYRFGEDWIDVPVPEFGRYDAKDADEWLRDYVSSVNARLGSGPKPEPSNPPPGDLRPLRLVASSESGAFSTDAPKKSVEEILRETAKALRDNGHGCVTTPLFWDCECAADFRRVSWLDECPICGAQADDQPDSRLHEVLDEMAVAYEASPLGGVTD